MLSFKIKPRKTKLKNIFILDDFKVVDTEKNILIYIIYILKTDILPIWFK